MLVFVKVEKKIPSHVKWFNDVFFFLFGVLQADRE